MFALKEDLQKNKMHKRIGAVVNIDCSKSHKIVDNALSIVEKLEHRADKDASGETGDGVGILVQISHDFFTKVTQNGENKAKILAVVYTPA